MQVKRSFGSLLISSFVFCSMLFFGGLNPSDTSFAETTASEQEPKVVLTASPRNGFAPLRVTLKAIIKGGEGVKAGCLPKEWLFGDGAVSSEVPNCSEEAAGDSEFFIEHVYDESGTFNARFVLGNRIISKGIGINVLSR